MTSTFFFGILKLWKVFTNSGLVFPGSTNIIGLIFERGAFTQGDTQLVSQIQTFYLLQIPFYVLGVMGVRLLSALKKNQVLMAISAINLVANIVGNYVFMHYLGVALVIEFGNSFSYNHKVLFSISKGNC